MSVLLVYLTMLASLTAPTSRLVGFCPIDKFLQMCLSCRKTELPIKYSTLHMSRNTQDCLNGLECCGSSRTDFWGKNLSSHALMCATHAKQERCWAVAARYSMILYIKQHKGGNCSVGRGGCCSFCTQKRQSWRKDHSFFIQCVTKELWKNTTLQWSTTETSQVANSM